MFVIYKANRDTVLNPRTGTWDPFDRLDVFKHVYKNHTKAESAAEFYADTFHPVTVKEIKITCEFK